MLQGWIRALCITVPPFLLACLLYMSQILRTYSIRSFFPGLYIITCKSFCLISGYLDCKYTVNSICNKIYIFLLHLYLKVLSIKLYFILLLNKLRFCDCCILMFVIFIHKQSSTVYISIHYSIVLHFWLRKC